MLGAQGQQRRAIIKDVRPYRTYSNPLYFESFTAWIFQATGKSETETAHPFPIPSCMIQNWSGFAEVGGPAY